MFKQLFAMCLVIATLLGFTTTNAVASIGAAPNEYTTAIVMKRFDNMKAHLYEASKVSGFDMADLVAISSIESTLRGNVKSRGSNAAGALQYTPSTWKQDRALYAKQLGLPANVDVYNTRANLLIGATALRNLQELLIEKSHLTKETVRIGDLYMSHLVGTNGALAIINSYSNKPINQIISVNNGNRPMYFKPNGQVRTAREFRLYLDMIVKRERAFYLKAVSNYQIAKASAPVYQHTGNDSDANDEMAVAIANTTRWVGYDFNS